MRIWREKTTHRFSGLPYVFALVQCELWGTYALFTPHMTAPLVTNFVGVTFEVREKEPTTSVLLSPSRLSLPSRLGLS